MTRFALLLLGALIAGAPGPAHAHPLRTGYLELERGEGDTYRVAWTMPAAYGEAPKVELRFDDRCSRPEAPTATPAMDRVARTWTMRCAGGLGGTRVAAQGLTAAQADILVRLVEEGETVATGRLAPLAPELDLPDRPGAGDVALTYLVLGVEHILLGVDHLLFVTALLLLVGGFRRLVATVTAFTLAHSLTLGLAVLGLVRLPGPPVEALIALSIALAAAAALRARPELPAPRPWLLAFVFGLLHGLGFAGALGEVGVPGDAIPLALLFFNLGVEAGQLAFVGALLLAAAGWRRLPWPRPRWSGALVPYAIGSVAMFWTIERVAAFWGG